ncbi:MAG: pyruvate, phosphate dikinase [Fibrobacteria bacterium]|nr:pyruvate, phosphate dikinase [Fibrobacteria bacterium]
MQPSTGLLSLDNILQGIRPGDNIVWQVDAIKDFLPFVQPFCSNAIDSGKELIYFRFAKHKQLLNEGVNIQIHQLYPEKGFEAFITEIHRVIEKTGYGGYYIFDSLSELSEGFYSDRMVGNFFSLTCPLLYDIEAIAYFIVFRNVHSYHAALPISQTTQILLNIYNHENKIYVHPVKVSKRYSRTMFNLHAFEGDELKPVTQSPAITEALSFAPWPGLQSASYRSIGTWDRRFIHAEEILDNFQKGNISKDVLDEELKRLIRLVISKDKEMLRLADKYLELKEIIYIWKRMIGCGMVGGKTVGLFLSRAILKKTDKRWYNLFEKHDSFFIGSDVFYTFIVQNGCWWIRQKQKSQKTFLENVREARQRILKGVFPDYIVSRFTDMLEYYGQSPIIVRSSSLMEDAFGNAFSGKYESVFCTNQGPINQRLEEFLDAVRVVFASAMSERALNYRAQRGLLDGDEQMALLVQRVSGAPYGNYFYPQLAGVGLSSNPYVWDENIDPSSGMLRIVFGLGTRAVDRHDDDYARLVSINAPDKRPEANFEEVRRYAQKSVDVLDLESNQFCSKDFAKLLKQSPCLPIDMFASKDLELERRLKNQGRKTIYTDVITFNKLFSDTSFLSDMGEILKTLKKAYKSEVDIEFSVNFIDETTYKINLLQCRPIQLRTSYKEVGKIPKVNKKDLILDTHSGVIGQSRITPINRLIYVVPSQYSKLPEKDRYTIARIIGKLVHSHDKDNPKSIMLIGPGRWGTTTASLGVPVSFAEINSVTAICEIDVMHEGLVTDLSLGTHFFGDIVELDMLYIAFQVGKKENSINEQLLLNCSNELGDLLPEAKLWADTVRVIDSINSPGCQRIVLNADSIKQRAVLYGEK